MRGLLAVGELVGDGYRIKSQKDTDSGQAELYVCEKDGKEFILKYYIWPGSQPSQPDFGVRDKLKSLDAVGNQNIIKLYELGTHKNSFFSVMEYARGGALNEKAPDGKYKYLPLSEPDAEKVVREVVGAFKCFHDNGLIHRDIKPENLFYRNKDGTGLVIGDFGICASYDKDVGMTKHITKSRAGTEGFSAPEAYSGVIGPELDYYALGITLWMLLTGKEPFVADDGERMFPAQIMLGTIQGKVADMLLAKSPELSPKMKTLIQGLLTVRHDKRWNYDDVCNFLSGKDVAVWKEVYDLPAFAVGSRRCTSLKQIAEAFIEDKESAREVIYRGSLTQYLIRIDRNLTDRIASLIEKYSAANKEEGIVFIAYALCPNLGFKLSDADTICDLKDFVSALDSKPDLMRSYLTDESKGLYVFLSAIGLEDISKKIKEIVQSSTSKLMIRKRILIALDGNTIRPFKDGVNDNIELQDIEQLSRLSDYLKLRILLLVNANNQKLCSWIENLTGCDLPLWRRLRSQNKTKDAAEPFAVRWNAFYSFVKRTRIIAYSKFSEKTKGITVFGLKDPSGDIAFTPMWQDCLEQGFDNRFIVQKNNSWGVVDSKGNVILPFCYNGIQPLCLGTHALYQAVLGGKVQIVADKNQDDKKPRCLFESSDARVLGSDAWRTVYFYDSKHIYAYDGRTCELLLGGSGHSKIKRIIGKIKEDKGYFWVQEDGTVTVFTHQDLKRGIRTGFSELVDKQNYDAPFIVVKGNGGYWLQSIDNKKSILSCMFDKIIFSKDATCCVVSAYGKYCAYQINADGSLGDCIPLESLENPQYIYELENPAAEFSGRLNYLDAEGKLGSYSIKEKRNEARTELLEGELGMLLELPFGILNKLLLNLQKQKAYTCINQIVDAAGDRYYNNRKELYSKVVDGIISRNRKRDSDLLCFSLQEKTKQRRISYGYYSKL
ncbi:MAG: protein kinase [Treponema sp.]|nr:protein kinase [Treponema sp.]